MAEGEGREMILLGDVSELIGEKIIETSTKDGDVTIKTDNYIIHIFEYFVFEFEDGDERTHEVEITITKKTGE